MVDYLHGVTMHFAHTISSRSSIALPKGCVAKTIDSRLSFGLRLLSVLDLVYELAVKLVPGGFCLKAPGLDDCAPPSSGLQMAALTRLLDFAVCALVCHSFSANRKI